MEMSIKGGEMIYDLVVKQGCLITADDTVIRRDHLGRIPGHHDQSR
jgi:hypothetical protein